MPPLTDVVNLGIVDRVSDGVTRVRDQIKRAMNEGTGKRECKHGKTETLKSVRLVPTASWVRAVLLEARMQAKTSYVLNAPQGGLCYTEYISKRVPRLLAMAELQRKSAYQLKHAFCTHTILHGGRKAFTGLSKVTGVRVDTC